MASDNELLIKLGVESSSASKQIKEITKELKTLDKQMDSVDKSVDGFNQSMSGIGKQAGLFQDKLDLLNTQLNLYKNRLEDASNQLDKAKKKMQELGERTKENGDEWDKANKKLEVAQTRYNNTVRNMKEVEVQIESTNREIRKLGEAVDDLNFDKFSGEIDQLNADLKSLDTVIDSFDTSTSNFGRSMQNAMDKLGAYGDKITVLNKSIDKHKEALKSTESIIKSVENYLASLGERTEENADEWDRASDYIEKYKDKQNELENSLREVQSELRATTTEVQELNAMLYEVPLERVSEKLRGIGEGFQTLGDAMQPLSTAMIGLGTVAGKTAMDFEDAMAKVQATSGVSAEELEILEQKARQIGSTTQLSATQGAEALLLLAQAGYDTEQSLTMVDAVVNLAIANEMDLARATEIVTASMNAYGWELDRTQELTDILSAVSRASSTDVGEIGEAFRTVAPTANALGFEVADVSMVLGLMANNAIHGAEAGNGLKSILSSLVKPTENGAKALKELGVEVADSQGNMKDLDEIIVGLQEAFKRLSEEEQAQIATTLVGKMQMSKFLAIVNSGGDDVDKLSEAISNCTGLTEEMRDTMENTSGGAWREFQSTMEETAIIVGDKLLPHFVNVLEKISDLAIKFGELDETTQSTILKFGAFLAVLSPISSGIGTLFNGLSSITGIMAKVGGAVGGASTATQAFSASLGGLGATATGTFASLSAGLSATAMAIAPWLLGGAIVTGLGLGIAYIVTNYDTLRDKILGISEEWDYGNSLMEKATENFADEVSKKFEMIKGDIESFEQDGINLLVTGMRTLNEDGTNDFSMFLNSCQTEMTKAKGAIESNAKDITDALGFMNTDIATVFSFQDLATIQEEWSGQMTRGLETAYTNLETTINEKDTFIKGLMETHGVDFETAYATWEGNVLRDYQIFCDALIEAQTGYQEQSLGSLEQFLLEEDLIRHGDLTEVRNKIHDSYSAQADQIEREYDVLLTKILQGETEIDGIKFSSAEQAMKYADMVKDYKIAQIGIEQEKEIQMATELAYQKGIISKAEYEQYVKDSQDRMTLHQNEVDGLTQLIQKGAEGISYEWECAWEAIKLAEQQGIPASMIRNEDFIKAVTKYFEEGGTDMQEAITTAYDDITNTTEESRIEIEKELGKLDTTTKKNMDNVITYMNDMGLSLEDACALYNVDTELMEGYIRRLASGVEGSSLDIRDEFIKNTTESKTMTGAVSKNFESMNTRVMSALVEMDGSLIVTDNTMQNTGKTARNALPIVASSAEQMGTRVRSALVDTQGNFISTDGVVARETSSMQNKINSLKGKEVDVRVNFKAINYYDTIAKMQSAQTHVYSAVIPSYKDSLIPTINFGENYTEDLYGLKDAGIKTISLAHLEDGISAYATKDSTASEMVTESVYNHNANTTFVSKMPKNNNAELLKALKEMADNQNNTGDVYVNIEVKNGNPQEIIKILDNYLKPRSKKW